MGWRIWEPFTLAHHSFQRVFMRITSTLFLLGGLAAMFVGQGGSSMLQGHVKALQDASTLTGTLTVQPIGGAPTPYRISYAKPNLIKIETADGWTLSDGKTIYSFVKKDNAWSESPASDEAIGKTAGLKEAWAWRVFFDKDAFKNVVSSKAGQTRVIKGTQVTELSLVLENGTATLFVDPKLGFARGFTFKLEDSDLLVTSTDIALGKEPPAADAFTFHAPEGAKKQVAPAADAATFAAVQSILSRNCMPCHGAQVRSGGHDLSSHQGVLGAVTAGSPEQSALVRSVSGPRPSMPKMRAPLSAKDVETLSKWVAAGAKSS